MATTDLEARLPQAADRKAGRVRRAVRDRQINSMLLAGATEDEIAEALGMRRAAVVNAIRRQLVKWRTEDKASIEEIRELQLKRVDRLVRALWNSAIGVADDGTRTKPNHRSVAEIRKLEGLRAAIAGTEAPKRVEVALELGIQFDEGEADRLERAWAGSGGEVVDVEAVEITSGG